MIKERVMTKQMLAIGVVALVVGAAACGGSREAAATQAAPAAPPAVKLAPDNVATVAASELRSGPAVSGQLTPAREATVRAQVGGSVVTLTVDKGQAVSNGQIIAKISARDLDDAMTSAQAAIKAAE